MSMMMLDLFDDGAHDLMMPWGHDVDDSDGCLMMSFGHGDDMMMSCLGDMIQWRLLDEFRPSYDMMLLLVMRCPFPLLSTTLALALPILAIPCKTLIHPS